MQSEASLSFLPLARVGDIRFGIAPGWFAAQAVGLIAFGVLAYAIVAGHLDQGPDAIEALRVALILLVALDLTVLVHEAGHAIAASAAGVSVRAVVLMAWGGATIREATPGPGVARWTAAGGPLANVLAGGLFLITTTPLDPRSAVACTLLIAGAFQVINAVANLLPVACLDGAHIFALGRDLATFPRLKTGTSRWR
jgi:Zn-dependent protease